MADETQVCNGCQTGQCSANCNTCQSCNDNCENCTSCQGPQGSCLTAQTFCPSKEKILDYYNKNKFAFDPCPETTTRMGMCNGEFNQDTWDQIIAFINIRATVGDAEEGELGGSAVTYSENSNVSPFRATEFKRIADIVGYNYNTNEIDTNKKIFGSYFKSLETAANAMKISSTACDACNTDCNCGCNKCNVCLANQCSTCCNGGQTSCGDKKCCDQSATTP